LVAVPETPLPIEALANYPLRDLAPIGQACDLDPHGWPLASHLTRRDLRAYVEQQQMISRGQAAARAARD
jgi:hypothetical protein